LNLLLDTMVVFCWFAEPERISRSARLAVADELNDVFISPVSAFEIAIKHRLGKLPKAEHLLGDFSSMIAAAGFDAIEVTVEHGLAVGRLATDHRDPFDRLLMAQALVEDLVLVTSDRAIRASGVPTLW